MRSKQPLIDRHYGAQKEFNRIRADTIVGMAFSNLIALSIIFTAAATLHAAGKTDIQTSAQAAEALRPIAGKFAEVIFALGIVGTGLLAIPVLAGATAYAVGEGRRWPVGLARKPKEAAAFYAVLALSAGIGIALNFTSINPISALYWSAVINGVLAVPVMVLLMFMARRKDVMDRFVITGPLYWLGWLSTAAMLLSVVAMGVGFFPGVARMTRAWQVGTVQSFRNTIDAIQPVISAMKAVDEPIDKTVLPRGGGDELLEADLDDLERGLGLASPARHRRTV